MDGDLDIIKADRIEDQLDVVAGGETNENQQQRKK